MTRRTHLKRGFTLTEVLIALGIMGIGLTMVSAMFPAAIKQEIVSHNNNIGGQVAKNGIAVAKSILRHQQSGSVYPAGGPYICYTPAGAAVHSSVLVGESHVGAMGGNTINDSNANWSIDELKDQWVYVYDGNANNFPFRRIASNTANSLIVDGSLPSGTGEYHLMTYSELNDHQYPMVVSSGTVNAGSRGSLVLARYLALESLGTPPVLRPLNSYQFVSVAWQRLTADKKILVIPHLVATGDLVTNTATGVTTIKVNDLSSTNPGNPNLVLGSPVIDLETGQYAYVDRVQNAIGTEARLTHALVGKDGTVSSVRWVAGIVQKGDTDTSWVSTRSPVINVTVTQAAVRP